MFLCIKSRQSIIMDRIRRLETLISITQHNLREDNKLYVSSGFWSDANVKFNKQESFKVDCYYRAINRMYKIYSQQLKKK